CTSCSRIRASRGACGSRTTAASTAPTTAATRGSGWTGTGCRARSASASHSTHPIPTSPTSSPRSPASIATPWTGSCASSGPATGEWDGGNREFPPCTAARPPARRGGKFRAVISVVLPSLLATQAGGRKRFEVDGPTVEAALRALPIADLILAEDGVLRPLVN